MKNECIAFYPRFISVMKTSSEKILGFFVVGGHLHSSPAFVDVCVCVHVCDIFVSCEKPKKILNTAGVGRRFK